MLKRIETSQLRIGMFIESFEGVWLNAPHTGRRFLLEKETDAEAIRRSNLSGIFINTAKGVDTVGAPAKQRPVRAASPTAKASQHTAVRQAKARASAEHAIAETTDLLKGVFDTARSSGGVTVEAVAPIITQIAASMERNGDILISMTRLKSRDEATFLHSIAVSALMIRFARYLKLDSETVRILGMSGLLHDIGKISIPTDVLNKESKLTDEEMALIRTHTSKGHDLLSRYGGMPDIVLDVCLHHHERPDGKGYPVGLSGNEISLHARIASICDVYDAVTSVRPYKRAWSAQEAATWMLERKGVFDRQLLLQFLNGVLKS